MLAVEPQRQRLDRRARVFTCATPAPVRALSAAGCGVRRYEREDRGRHRERTDGNEPAPALATTARGARSPTPSWIARSSCDQSGSVPSRRQLAQLTEETARRLSIGAERRILREPRLDAAALVGRQLGDAVDVRGKELLVAALIGRPPTSISRSFFTA